MKNRLLRIALVVLAVAGQAAAGLLVYRAERQRDAAAVALGTLTREVGRAQALVGDLRSAQTGLVAIGQDPSFWVSKIAGLTRDATSALEPLGRNRLGTEASQDLAAATAALAEFTQTNDRIRDLLATDQASLASEVAFGDAAKSLAKAGGALAALVPSQVLSFDRDAAAERMRVWLALGGAAALTLIVLLLLLPRAGYTPAAEDVADAPAAGLGLSLTVPSPAELGALGRTGFDLDIRDTPPAPPADLPPEPPRESEVAIVEGLQRESQLPLNADAQVDLPAAARLCTDLAKVREASELPVLLGRAAEVLDASGIVLWMVGAEGTVLRPAASIGYSDHTLAKMKALSGRSDNAVAVSYRLGRMEVVAGSKERNGALVVPVVTAGGCVGAMAAEIRHGGELSPSVQSVATIVAAQLASLVAESSA